MRSLSRIGFALALAFSSVQPAFPQTIADTLYRESVEYEDGKITVDFDQTPLGVALNAIQVKTGLQITVPPATESKLLNLRLSRLPLEPAVRSLIAYIGFRSFALVYDEEGHPKRAVVLEARPEVRLLRVQCLEVLDPGEGPHNAKWIGVARRQRLDDYWVTRRLGGWNRRGIFVERVSAKLHHWH